MMQEMLLFGQVSAEHHQSLRQQLAGLARMEPQPVLERHLIFRPFVPPGLSNLPAGNGPQGAQQQELQRTRQMLNAILNYMQLVGVAEGGSFVSQSEEQAIPLSEIEDHDSGVTESQGESRQGKKAFQWYLEFKDVPEPGKVSTTSRAMSKTRVLEGDPIKFLKDLGYEYLSQYIITGDKFYDQDTTLFLHAVMQVSDQDTPDAISIVDTVPDISKLVPLDPSGGYVLQASIEIADGNSPDLKDNATQQLLAMKETLRSSVRLEPGDRLALDTRVPARKAR